jgi:hypothetical protein
MHCWRPRGSEIGTSKRNWGKTSTVKPTRLPPRARTAAHAHTNTHDNPTCKQTEQPADGSFMSGAGKKVFLSTSILSVAVVAFIHHNQQTERKASRSSRRAARRRSRRPARGARLADPRPAAPARSPPPPPRRIAHSPAEHARGRHQGPAAVRREAAGAGRWEAVRCEPCEPCSAPRAACSQQPRLTSRSVGSDAACLSAWRGRPRALAPAG